MLITRFNVPPKPAAIREGDCSLITGSLAPNPTPMPERPRHNSSEVPWCSTINNGGMPSRQSLSRISSPQGTSRQQTEKRNLAQRMESRYSGSRPSSQKRRPSRLTRGKTNRVVKVDISRPTTERFMKLTMFTHSETRTV